MRTGLPDPAPEFRYLSGDPALDLVNTVSWTARGPAHERLTSYERLARWAEGAGLLSRATLEALRRLARSRPAEAEEVVARARRLRAALRRVCQSLGARRIARRPEPAWRELERTLAVAAERRRITPLGARDPRESGRVAAWTWDDPETRLDAPLWGAAWSAAELFASADARRIRACAGADCGWLFVDRSRNHLRRWCSMETCGTAAKTFRRRVRNLAT